MPAHVSTYTQQLVRLVVELALLQRRVGAPPKDRSRVEDSSARLHLMVRIRGFDTPRQRVYNRTDVLITKGAHAQGDWGADKGPGHRQEKGDREWRWTSS